MGGLLAVPLQSGVAAAATRTIAIGVDHSTPAGHNFEYVDYFPRSGVTVHAGDVLDFGWANTPDGLHTATLLKTGESPTQAWQNNPLAAPDGDDPFITAFGHPQLQINPTVGAPTHPPAGSPAPGACGNTATPCAFSGASDLNSGASPTDGTTHFVVRVTAGPGTYSYVCLIHPGMVGSFTVVDPSKPATSPGHAAAQARKQAKSDTEGALDAEEAVPAAQTSPNGDGTHTVTLTAGAATPFVEIAEMLPVHAKIRAGDTVKWVSRSLKDPHTVTFPQGNDPSTEPLPNLCEGSPDVLLTGPPGVPPCGDPTKFETHLNPDPSGGTVILSPSTVATSGVFFPTGSYSFSFPNTGTYTYQCRIHDHMIGTVQVRPAHRDPGDD